MAHRLRLAGPLCVVVAIGLITTMNASGASKQVSCSTQVNDTAAKLLPCITKTDLTNHMQALENIAIANPVGGHPSRNSGEPGYLASAEYVADLMQQAGYNVTLQPYTFL